MGLKISKSTDIKWQQSFAYSDNEKRIIEEIIQRHKCSFNSALRFIVCEFERTRKQEYMNEP